MTKEPSYTPPHSIEAEQSTLGAILVRPEVLDDVADLLAPEDFYRETHAKIYRAMLGLYNRNEPVDLVTVCSRLREVGWLEGCGGPLFLAGLSEQVGFAVNAIYYARIVRDKATLRRLLVVSQEIAAACLSPVEVVKDFLDQAEQKILQIGERGAAKVEHLSSLASLEVKRLENLDDHIKQGKSMLTGVPSGFFDLDALTNGFQPSDLIVLAARPSMGKTALAGNIALNAANKDYPGVYFNLEMSNPQMVRRFFATEGRIISTHLLTGKLNSQEWFDLYPTQNNLEDIEIYLCDVAGATPTEIRAISRRLKRKYGIKWIIVDYLQLLRDPTAKSREREVGGCSQAMKELAKEIDLPVILLSQLNRELERRTDKRPVMPDLRDSGQVEQDADLILFIYRDEVYNDESDAKGVAEIRVAKNRNGPLGLFRLTYLEQFMRFANHSSLAQPGQP